jgi:hypothetical protein
MRKIARSRGAQGGGWSYRSACAAMEPSMVRKMPSCGSGRARYARRSLRPARIGTDTAQRRGGAGLPERHRGRAPSRGAAVPLAMLTDGNGGPQQPARPKHRSQYSLADREETGQQPSRIRT